MAIAPPDRRSRSWTGPSQSRRSRDLVKLSVHHSVHQRPLATIALTAMLVSGVLAGCKTNDHGQVGSLVVFSDDGQYLDPPIGTGVVLDAQQAIIPDCPPPVGFVPIADACSVSVTPGGARSVYHLYQGRSAPREVQLAYRRNLPHYEWELAGTVDDPETGYPALVFHKGIESLYVRVRQDRSKTSLVIEIAPR